MSRISAVRSRALAILTASALVVGGLLVAPAAASAADGGSISGSVSDGAGGILQSDLTVSLKMWDYETSTDKLIASTPVSSGHYAFSSLPLGSSFTVIASGGTYLEQTLYASTYGDPVTLDIKMHLPMVISGVAVAGDNSYVNVTAYQVQTDAYYSQTSWGAIASADGTYSVTVPADFGYRVGFSSRGYTQQYFPHVNTVEAPEKVTGATVISSARNDVNATLIPGFEISGSVTGEDAPLYPDNTSYSSVQVNLRSSVAPYDVLTSSSVYFDGAFSFDGIPNGTYLLEFAGNPDWKAEYWDDNGHAALADATPLTIDGADRTDIGAELAPRIHYSIAGTVYAGAGHTLKTTATYVSLYTDSTSDQSDDSYGQYVTGTSTNTTDGSYTFANLDPGTYYVYFSDSDVDSKYFAQWYGKTEAQISRSTATPIVITDGGDVDTTGVDTTMTLRTPLSISGTASVSSGSPAPASYKIELQYQYADGDWFTNDETTSTTGAYSFSDLFSGSNYHWRVIFSAGGGYSRTVLPVSLTFASKTNVDAQLEKLATHKVSGTLAGYTSTFGWDPEVTAYQQFEGEWEEVASMSAKNGTYSLDLAAGTYRLKFDPADRVHSVQYYNGTDWNGPVESAPTTDLVVGDADLTTINASFNVAPAITGVVRNSAGTPLPYAWVTLYRPDSNWESGWRYVYSTSADSKGVFRFIELEPGVRYTLEAEPNEDDSLSQSAYLGGSISAPSSATAAGTFAFTGTDQAHDISLPDAPLTTGTVVNSATGAGVSGATVTIYEWSSYDAAWFTYRTLTTNSSGQYSTVLRYSGSYAIKVVKATYATQYTGGGSTMPTAPTGANSIVYTGGALNLDPVKLVSTLPPIVASPPPGGESQNNNSDSSTSTTSTTTTSTKAATTGTTAATATKALPLVKAATPKVSGTFKVGKKIKAAAGKWAKGTKLSYQWFANGKAIKKATKSSFKLTASVKGKKITVKVTGKKKGFTTVVKTSKQSAKVK